MLPSIFVNAQPMRCLNLAIVTRFTQTTLSGAYLFPVKSLVPYPNTSLIQTYP